MIELNHDRLEFRFPEVHPEARLFVELERTLRIPDDGREYPLPPGLGAFPLRQVDDHASSVPADWLRHGGVLLPMYQSEAMWLCFDSPMVDERAPYCFLVKVATGKINAVTGEEWNDGVHRDPQDYLVVPTQPWLDGTCVGKGLIRQFVAMPLGAGYSVEEQLTGEAAWGGLQLAVHPMKREVFERRFPRVEPARPGFESAVHPCMLSEPAPGMGLAPGGKMRQWIYEDPYELSDWDLRHRSRCFVHLANSLVWRAITGEEPPLPPLTAADYTRQGLPWFDYYRESPAVEGAKKLEGLESVATLATEKGEKALPENESVTPAPVVPLRTGLSRSQVREWP